VGKVTQKSIIGAIYKMKICILSTVNIKHMSLISLYTDYFDRKNIAYDLIYIDKYDEEEKITAQNIYKYIIKVERNWNRLKKLFIYLGFRRYAKSVINANKYDFIIVWNTFTALMFTNFLSTIMKKKYCINIRDYCMEKNPIVYQRVKKVIKNSLFTTISSNGFKKFLPKNDYILVHSYNSQLLNTCLPKTSLKKHGEPIHICFIGYVRFYEADKKIISAFANDNRYIIQYFGEGSQYLADFAKKNNIRNVEFCNGFQVEETKKYLERADVLNNLYGYGNMALDTAVSIKYYYALHMNIPILVYKGTYMEQISCESGIGFAVGSDLNSLADDFYNWYHQLDFKELSIKCKKSLEDIKNANLKFYQRLDQIFI